MLSVAAMLAASAAGRAQLAPYSREELDSLFTVTLQWSRESPALLDAPLLACVAYEKRREAALAVAEGGERGPEIAQPSFLAAAEKVTPRIIPRLAAVAGAGAMQPGEVGDWMRRQIEETASLPVAGIGVSSRGR